MEKLYGIITIIFFILIISLKVEAQTKYQVVTKNIERNISDIENKRIHINAEKANIKINSWTKNSMKLVLKLSTKNTNRKIAKKELDYHKYIIDESRKEIFIRNYVLIKDNSLQSILTAEYELFIPRNCDLIIENQLGDVEIENLNGKLSIVVKYCNVTLNKLQTKLNAEIDIGNLICTNSKLVSDIKTTYTDVNMYNISGTNKLETAFGNLLITPGNELSSLFVKSSNADVNFINKNCYTYNYELLASIGKIFFLNQCLYINDEKILHNTENKNKKLNEFRYMDKNNKTKIFIRTKQGNITVN